MAPSGSWGRGLDAIEVSDEYGIADISVKVAYVTEDDQDDVQYAQVPIDQTTGYSDSSGLGPEICYEEPCYVFVTDTETDPVPDDGHRVGYIINATDKTGNTATVVIKRKEGNETETGDDPGEIQTESAVGVAFAGATGTRSGYQVGQSIFSRTVPKLTRLSSTGIKFISGAGTVFTLLTWPVGTAGGGEDYTMERDISFSTSGPEVAVPTTATAVATYSAAELPTEEVALFSGTVVERNGHTRGHGLEYIQATTGLTQADVASAVSEPLRVIQDGGRTYVIGEGEAGKLVVVTIVGGVIVAATDQATIQRERETTRDESTELEVEPVDDLSGPSPRPIPPEVIQALRIVGGVAVKTVGEAILDGRDDDDDTYDGDMRTTFIDMGKGQSVLFKAPDPAGRNKTLLVDAGAKKSRARADSFRSDILTRVEPNEEGVHVIDHLIVTHNHTDHIAFVDLLLESELIRVRNLYFNGIAVGNSHETDIDRAVGAGTSTDTVRSGDSISFGEATVQVLAPNGTADAVGTTPPSSAVDANSVVLTVKHDTTKMLVTGDIRAGNESYITSTYESELDTVDAMPASHHATSAADETVVTDQLLDATTPWEVIISNRNDSERGASTPLAPDCAVFDRADKRSIEIYWTAVHGDITYQGDDKATIERNSDLNDPADLKDRVAYCGS